MIYYIKYRILFFLLNYERLGNFDMLSSGLKIGKSNFSQYSGHVGTEPKTWSNVKLAVFLACNTGQESENIAFIKSFMKERL